MPQNTSNEEHGGCQTTLTDLPQCIIDYIVSFLSLRDLARMRVSTKAWRNLCYTTPYIRLDITRPLDCLYGFKSMGLLGDKLPSLRCELRLSNSLHDEMSTMSLCDVEFLKLYTNFSDFEMQFMASFLKRFPNLKFLAIHRSSWNDCRSFPQSNVSTSYWGSQNLDFVPRLQIVEINLCPGNALELVKYFIKNGEMKCLFVTFSEKIWKPDELIRLVQDMKKDKTTGRPGVVFKEETLIRSS